MRDPRELCSVDLERVVAIEVLTWTPSDRNDDYCDWKTTDGEWIGCWGFSDVHQTDSWDGMAKVIDALRGRGLYVDIRTCDDHFEVSVTTNGHALIYACADQSAPRAVAIAAIEAVRFANGFA
jgi:hypothetical protein